MIPNAIAKIVDEKTGEEISAVPAFIQRRQRNAFDLGWSQLRTVNLSDDKDTQGQLIMRNIMSLSGTAHKVLLGLLFVNGYRNEVTVDIGEFADLCELSKQNLYRAFRELSNAGLLEKRGRGQWYISDLVMWRGRARDHEKQVRANYGLSDAWERH